MLIGRQAVITERAAVDVLKDPSDRKDRTYGMPERSAGSNIDDLIESLVDEFLHAEGGIHFADAGDMNGNALQFGLVVHFFRQRYDKGSGHG